MTEPGESFVKGADPLCYSFQDKVCKIATYDTAVGTDRFDHGSFPPRQVEYRRLSGIREGDHDASCRRQGSLRSEQAGLRGQRGLAAVSGGRQGIRAEERPVGGL